MLKKLSLVLICLTLLVGCGQIESETLKEQIAISDSNEAADSDSMMYQYSTTLETEKPELDEVTKQLISDYHKNPTQENYDKLRTQVEINYEEVLSKKKAKLEELKETAKEQSKITEMEEIVTEMINDRENRIDQTMFRLTDSRLHPGSDEAENGYVPVMGAGENVYISTTPITNAEYSLFLQATGYDIPENWSDGNYPVGQDDYPVVFVSYKDAEAYCEWMTNNDDSATYRLPSEAEWELAAGHMPKDAKMNTGNTNGITSVYEYSETVGASGAVDMWGNVWEWTSTERNSNDTMAIKGGAWNSPKTDCRTEYREEGRDMFSSYDNVGFRIIKENKL